MCITLQDYALDITKGEKIWLSENPDTAPRHVWASRRVGIDYAEDFRDVPWRYFDPNSKYVSKRFKGEEIEVV